MSTYLELLADMTPKNNGECGLGKILAKEGQAKHDLVLETIFAINPEDGKPYSYDKLSVLFMDEYGWSPYFFRRHRNGSCKSCLKRTPTQSS